MKKIYASGLVLLISFLIGCASIMSGGTQKISISSSPDKANIEIYDVYNMKIWSASTPAIATLKRGDGYFSGAIYRVEITKEGYEKQVIQISSSLNGGWYLPGNCLLGGFIGWLIVDPISGAMWNLEPKNITSDLRRTLSFDDNGNIDGIYIILKEEIPEDIFVNMELVKIN